MILVCPACHTRYQVEDRALARTPGRMVRCANCSHSWRYMTPPSAPLTAPPIRIVEPNPIPPAASPRAAISALPPSRRRRSWLGWVILVLLAGGAAAAIIVERDPIVALWPPAARLYEMVHLKVEPLGAGLEFVGVALTRNADGLIVEGEIANRLKVPCAVPHLRVALRDGGQKELLSKVIPPPRDRLLPGESMHFIAAFLPASDAAATAKVTFVPG